jgi:hypothetical protein
MLENRAAKRYGRTMMMLFDICDRTRLRERFFGAARCALVRR